MTITTNRDLIAAWDRGDEVMVVDMGGEELGEKYEHDIQLMMIEILRKIERQQKEITFANLDDLAAKVCVGRGVSGMQVRAATQAAAQYFMNGYRDALATAPRDRIIIASKSGVTFAH